MFGSPDPGRGDPVPVPHGLGLASCHAYPPIGPHGQPATCNKPVAWTGVVLRKKGRDRAAQAWQSFACAEHADGLIARRRLLPRDWERLARLREEADRWRPGHPRRPSADDPSHPAQPLAQGEAAYDLIDRAREWERQHPAE
jgi:hypothetical protein